MNLPLMSPAALDNAVYELIVRELGVANAMRFIARHNHPDGIDYTRDRGDWLTQNRDDIEHLLGKPNPGYEQLVADSRKKRRSQRREDDARYGKSVSRKKNKR